MKHPESRLILFTACGFVVMWVDICIGHLNVDNSNPYMFVPIAFLPCAAAVTVVTAFWATPQNQKLFLIICFLAISVGALGFYFHLSRFQHNLTSSVEWRVLVRLMRYPPLFAPLAVSGLGILGLLVNRREQ